VIVPDEHGKQQANWEAIAAKAGKVVSFTDLAGHERYLKTTLAGLTGSGADFVLLIVGANAGLIGMSKVSEHQVIRLTFARIDLDPCPSFTGASFCRSRTLITYRCGCYKGRYDSEERLRTNLQAIGQDLAKSRVSKEACIRTLYLFM